jgi:hypothetical protein
MNEKYDIETGVSQPVYSRVSERYAPDTFVDIPLTSDCKTKLCNLRDSLVEDTLRTSDYIPIAENIEIKSNQCDNCIIC